jgi:UPF0716 protein FxsA
MFFYLFLLFTVVPLVELALLVWLGGQTEWWVPILLVLADGVAGALLWRWQGWKVLTRIQEDMAAGRLPADALVDGLLIFLAGALLITPGMLTDAVGFALLIPPIRAVVKRAARAWFVRHIQIQSATFRTTGPSRGQPEGGDQIPSPGRSPGGDQIPSPGRSSGGDQIIDARVLGTRVEDVP